MDSLCSTAILTDDSSSNSRETFGLTGMERGGKMAGNIEVRSQKKY